MSFASIKVLFACFLPFFWARTLVFRLDDVQCYWQEEKSLTLIQLFLDYEIPLSIGIVTRSGVDCFIPILKQMYDNNPDLLEVASHSVNHVSMMDMPLNKQIEEACDSKELIESFLGPNTVRTFIPPGNKWDYNTVTALVNCGYDIASCECTGAALGHLGGNSCTADMYYNRPCFFDRIDGLTHIPIGASIAPLGAENVLLTVEQLYDGTLEDCYSGNCSVNLQVSGMGPLTTAGDPDQYWASIMMHPQDFPDSWGYSELESWFLPVFQRASLFDLKTFQQVAGPVGSRPNVPGEPTIPLA